MPSRVFMPYIGVFTAVLTFVKGGKTDQVWFYNMESDGYSHDNKQNRIDEKRDIPDIIERFKAQKGKSSFVPVEEIIANNYDLSIYRFKEIEYEQVEYDPPEKIITEIEEIEKEILKNLGELKGMLS
jgi:type I restriction enzyme M protein